jgi:hypothetical protein
MLQIFFTLLPLVIFLVVLSLGVIVPLLFVIVVLRQVFKDYKATTPYQPGSPLIPELAGTTATRKVDLAVCPTCEATILAEASVCPHCGTPRPICMVCQHPLRFTDSSLQCPYCQGLAHRVHFLEYLKVKGTCPNCHADLDEHELIPTMNPSSIESSEE